jgi:hypothetical protein
MTVTIALAIPHTPWIPERVESMGRLLDELGITMTGGGQPAYETPLQHFRIFFDRAKNWEWSGAMWTWLARTDATHCLQLQDDVRVAPNFWPALRAMLEAVPDQVICLEVVHPAVVAVAREGYRWMTTSDLMVGVGYVLPRALLVEFLEWRSNLTLRALEAIPEDTLLAVWCVATGRRIWSPIPTIIDHDTSIPSTYGNDHHQHRRPPVRWDTHWTTGDALEHANVWGLGNVPHLGRFWDLTPLLERWVPGWTAEQSARYLRDDGARVKRRLTALERARATEDEPHARLLLCTPTRGSVHTEYANSVWQLATQIDLDVTNAIEGIGVHLEASSVVTARARMIHRFLETDCTHLLFVDADIAFDRAAVYGMLASGHDFVQTPYPARVDLDWDAVALPDDPRPIEARGHQYVLRTFGEWTVDAHNCAEIMGTGLGLTLISRKCLEAMTEHYRAALSAHTSKRDRHPIVLLTLLMSAVEEDGRKFLLSEDLSLCERWRAMGGKVHAYLGPGSPATHHGDYAFRGRIESLGLRRVST